MSQVLVCIASPVGKIERGTEKDNKNTDVI